ncbi:MAG: hypothetical protein AB1894_15705 [Chloroflexota bacterium]
MSRQVTPPSPDNCPLEATATKLEQLSKDMVRTMRQLRRDRQACARCTIEQDACPILHAHRPLVEAAISAINEEWNLAEVIQ